MKEQIIRHQGRENTAAAGIISRTDDVRTLGGIKLYDRRS